MAKMVESISCVQNNIGTTIIAVIVEVHINIITD